MRKIISLICLLIPILAHADELAIRENAPDRHVVVKGDTLWDISAKFFKDPWKWQQIWGLNKDTIKDPHWIYPGDVVFLDRSTGTLKIGDSNDSAVTNANATVTQNDVIKLSPRAREVADERGSIPMIPYGVIAPFLAKPLVVDGNDFAKSPILVGTYEQRELLGANDVAYVKNLPADKGTQWQVFRPGKTFVDPDTEEVLGNEVVYLGDAVVEKFAPVSELRITQSVLEIGKGDRFTQSTQTIPSNYEPHAPSTNIAAKVISIYGGVAQASQNAIITINKGKRDGIENGHVLALYQKGEVLKDKKFFRPKDVALPDVRYGLIFVFRTFHKVSYALVLQTRLPVELLDTAKTP
ncbi:MAG: LysM peptidoglycan-binding domain-containing protein [Gallionellaceae bacterium]